MEEVEKVCRICLDVESGIELISPCKCKGSMKWIHPQCYQEVRLRSNSYHCSICKQYYPFQDMFYGLKKHFTLGNLILFLSLLFLLYYYRYVVVIPDRIVEEIEKYCKNARIDVRDCISFVPPEYKCTRKLNEEEIEVCISTTTAIIKLYIIYLDMLEAIARIIFFSSQFLRNEEINVAV